MTGQQSPSRVFMNQFLALITFVLAGSLVGLSAMAQTTLPSETTAAAEAGKKPTKLPAKKKTKTETSSTSPEVVTPEVANTSPPEPVIEKVPTSFNGAPSYQFNTLATPNNTADRPTIAFKVPGTAAEESNKTMANPVQNMRNDMPFVTYVGYPKYQFGFTYAPNQTGFKQEYNNLPLNFSSSSMVSLDMLGKLITTPETSLEFEYSYYSVGIKAKDLGVYQIKDSKANVETMMVRGNYCFIYSNFFHRLCPGVTFGMDGYPSLNFSDTTSISITPIRDLVAGFNANYQYPLLPKMNFLSKFEYLTGLKNGQNDTLGVTANSKTRFNFGVDFPWNEKSQIETTFSYENRQATVSGKVGNITDTWKTNAVTLGFNVGMNYTWDSAP